MYFKRQYLEYVLSPYTDSGPYRHFCVYHCTFPTPRNKKCSTRVRDRVLLHRTKYHTMVQSLRFRNLGPLRLSYHFNGNVFR